MPKHVVFVTWKLGDAPAFGAAKRLGHEVTVIRSRVMERSQNIDLDATPYGRFIDLFRLAGGGDVFELLVRVYLDEEVALDRVEFTKCATVRWFGAAHAAPKPPQPDLSWTGGYGDALHSIHVRSTRGVRRCRRAAATSTTSARCRSCTRTRTPAWPSPRRSSPGWASR